MADKNSFLVYGDWENILSGLTLEQKGAILEALFAHENRGEDYSGSDGEVRMALKFMFNLLDRNREKYDESRRKKKEKAKQQWERQKKLMEDHAESCNTMDDHDDHGVNGNVKVNDNVNDNGNVNANVNANDNVSSRSSSISESDFESVFKTYFSMTDRITEFIKGEVISFTEDMGADLVCEAIRETASQGIGSWAYCKKILQRWKTCGYRTLEDISNERSQRTFQRGMHESNAPNQSGTAEERKLPGILYLD